MDDSINIDKMSAREARHSVQGARPGSEAVSSTLHNVDQDIDAPFLEAIDKIVSIDLEDDRTGPEQRPRVIVDAGEPLKDILCLSNVPKEMTYDRLRDLVEPFGEVNRIFWDANLPTVAEVLYEDVASAEEAMHYLSDSILGGTTDQLPLKAELRGREAGTQLFVGDLTPDVTETMLETAFSDLVQAPVTACLKRDPGSSSPIGYAFLSFEDEFAANKALVEGHRIAIGNANVRVGRAERNTFLYVSDLNFDVTLDDLKHVFGQHGALVEEDTVIVRRSYAFIRYRCRESAETAKRTLDKTSLRSRMSVRYAEAEPVKTTVQVQFHSSVPRPPSSLKDLLQAAFGKYGNCSIEIPRLHNGLWRKTAFVQFHGDSISATVAATDAVQNVKFVSNIPVLVQFARELIPRVSPKGFVSVVSGTAGAHEHSTTCNRSDASKFEKIVTSDDGRGGGADGSARTYSTRGRRHSKYFVPLAGSDGNQFERHIQCGETRNGHGDGESFPKHSNGSENCRPAPREGRNAVRRNSYYPTAVVPQDSRAASFDRSPHNQRRASLASNKSFGDGPVDNSGGQIAYVPVYMPVSAMGHPYAMSGVPGVLTESDFAAAASGYVAPQFHGPPPLMYPGQVSSPVQSGTFAYGIPMVPPFGMHGMNGHLFGEAEATPEASLE
jgi:RNA recognition motif-containing protein